MEVGVGVGVGVRGRGWGEGVKGTIAETTQTFTKMLTLCINIILRIVSRPKVSIFVL